VQSLTLHTTLGDLKIELACAQAPKLCENFLALAASGTYDGTRFHRNIAGFIVQGGDPTGTGKGGESIHGGKLPDTFTPSLTHADRGTVSMANDGPDTNGSQFFITYVPGPSLDGKYSVIGHLVPPPSPGEDGAALSPSFATLAAMERAPVTGKKHRPVEDIVVRGVTIHANPFAR
jgi:peptidyl-prolyl cis-trans isomerase-like 3